MTLQKNEGASQNNKALQIATLHKQQRQHKTTMVVQKKDRKAARKSALATLKSRRSGGGLSALNDNNDDDMHPSTNNSSSALDSYHATMEDVYDTYADEEEYRQLVEKEREREDFVVDDGEFHIEYMYL